MKRTRKASRREPTISLINIIFLILIFFMVTGTLSKPASTGLEFVQSTGLECCAGNGILQVDADGGFFVEGRKVASPEDYLAALSDTDPTIRIAPDRRLPARELLKIISNLRERSPGRILIITENTPS